MKKSMLFKILGIVVTIVMLLKTTSVFAANINDLNNQKESNQEKINETQKEKEEITAQKNKTVAEVEKLNTQISDYETQIDELEGKISNLNVKHLEDYKNICNFKKNDYNFVIWNI